MATEKRSSPWVIGIAALGLNLWLTLLVIPAAHHGRGPAAPVAVGGALVTALVFGGALLRRSPVGLLGLFPASLALPLGIHPQLLGTNISAPWTFGLVVLALLGYSLGGAAILRASRRAPEDPSVRTRKLDAGPEGSGVTGPRARLPRLLAAFAVLFPAGAIYTLYLNPGVQRDFRAAYPERSTSAALFLGGLALLLWVALYEWYLARPLRLGLGPDRELEGQLLHLRRVARRGWPRPIFYVWVAIALLLMGLAVWIV
ncbi:MAG: hypothetical protein IT371_02940 [Deltaproteobacteria bacterium]|nr:hypothetical protein [Deltaproteobacteria bacterium]